MKTAREILKSLSEEVKISQINDTFTEEKQTEFRNRAFNIMHCNIDSSNSIDEINKKITHSRVSIDASFFVSKKFISIP